MHDDRCWPQEATATRDYALDELTGRMDDRVFHIFPLSVPSGEEGFAFCGARGIPMGIPIERAGDRNLCPQCIQAIKGDKP